jgi:mRNA-degrading endonuclease HigB of HigAB toxin-antitoxin module
VCLQCAGLGDLEFLPAGNASLTRRAKAKSPRHAVVVRFSRSRGRHERQALLVEANRLIVATDFEKAIVWIKWIGAHKDYDKINVKEVQHGG